MKGGSDPNKAAMKLQREQMNRLAAIDLPELEELKLTNPELVGLLEAEQLGPSAMEDIQLDPKLKGMQMQALEALQQRSETGLTPEDKMAMEELMEGVGAQEKSQRAAIEQEMARKGMGDSGAALMSKLQSSQGSANQARQQARALAQQSSQARQQALAQMAQQASGMESADWQRQSGVASARDRIAAANAANRQQVSAQNLAARQAIANQQAALRNQETQYNIGRAQQQFQNELARAGAQGGVASNMSNIAAQTPQGPSTMQTIGTIAGGIAGASGGPAGIGAGATAGGAIGEAFGNLTGFEDGGIAQAQQQAHNEVLGKAQMDSMKQHEAFKKKYMKKVQDELLGSAQKEAEKEVVRAENGGVIHAANGEIVGKNANGEFVDAQGNVVNPYNNKFDTLKKGEALNATKIGMGNDATSAEVQSLADAKKLMPKKENSMDGMEMLKAGGDIAKALGGSEPQARPQLKLSAPSVTMPEDILRARLGNAGQFANPFTAEDGGVLPMVTGPSELRPEGGTDFASPEDRQAAALAALLQQARNFDPSQNIPMERPEYACGGVHKKADGGPIYASDGTGEIVDTGMESYAGDRIDAKLNDGEMVLNVPQQQRVMDMIRGKISPDELGDEDIIEGVPREYRDELHEMSEEEESEDPKIQGLKNLLEALGRK